MSAERRFEQDLPFLLEDLYLGSLPTYRDQILQQAARTHQRPAWSFLGRWLPMVDIARQSVYVPRLTWRVVGLGLLVIAALVALVATLVAGGHTHVPAPFGPAKNGLVAYASGGDIFTADAVTGRSTTIVRGPGDSDPRWSRDGTRLAFKRLDATSGMSLLFVVAADGSGMTQVTPRPIADIGTYSFSPDAKQILIAPSSSAFTSIVIAATDGSGMRQLNLPGRATDAAWRPPDGSEILFMDSGTDSSGFDSSIYAINPRSGEVRTVLAGADAKGLFRGHPAWSPDGSLISFGEWKGLNGGLDVQAHVVSADGTGDRTLPMPARAIWQSPESWSNDGTRLLVIRGYTVGTEQSLPVVMPVVGGGTGIEIPYPGGVGTAEVTHWEWAPNDLLILGTPTDASGSATSQVLLDPVAGTATTLPWQSVSPPSWQRLGS
jgi:Tol biopolymer transport system component